jgi:putative transposase
MARPKRIHSPGDLHYLVLRASAGRQVFAQAGDFPEFAQLVARHLAACRIRLLAFCWMPDAAHFALQVSDVPLGAFVQRIAAQHAQRINRRAGVRGQVFRQRYKAVIVTEPQLPSIVTHLHLMPLRLGLAADPADYPWTSHRSYLGLERLPWVTKEPALRPLESAAPPGSDAYLEFIRDQIERRGAAAVREELPPGDEEREFMRSLTPAKRRPGGDPAALDRLIDLTAARLNVRSDELRSRSRRRVLSLGRAVVAWGATQSGIARLSEVARRLGREPSTLSVGMERHRRRHPDLFDDPFAGGALPRSTPNSEG